MPARTVEAGGPRPDRLDGDQVTLVDIVDAFADLTFATPPASHLEAQSRLPSVGPRRGAPLGASNREILTIKPACPAWTQRGGLASDSATLGALEVGPRARHAAGNAVRSAEPPWWARGEAGGGPSCILSLPHRSPGGCRTRAPHCSGLLSVARSWSTWRYWSLRLCRYLDRRRCHSPSLGRSHHR
jgi:hypothetical protein